MAERGRGVHGTDWHYSAGRSQIPLAGPPTIIPRPAPVVRVKWVVRDGRAFCQRAAPDFLMRGRPRPGLVVLGSPEEIEQRRQVEEALKNG